MSDNIFGDRFIGFRQPAWHDKARPGGIFTEPLYSTIEAVRRCDADLPITKQPLSYQGADGAWYEIDRYAAVVRNETDDDPTQRLLAIVGKDYQLLGAKEVAEVCEPLARTCPVETVGVLGHGETMFITLRVGDVQIARDEVKLFHLITDTCDGTRGLTIAEVGIAVVCQNTLQAALGSATVKLSLGHRVGIRERLAMGVKLMERLKGGHNGMIAAWQQLAKYFISLDELGTIVKAAYPMPTPPASLPAELTPDDLGKQAYKALLAQFADNAMAYEQARAKAIVSRQAAKDIFNGAGRTYADGTAWTAYNAVVELEDFRKGISNNKLTGLLGSRAQVKQRAFDAALTIAK